MTNSRVFFIFNGYPKYAVALFVRRIAEAIVRTLNAILTVSSLLDGKYGLDGNYLWLPTKSKVTDRKHQNVLFSDVELRLDEPSSAKS